MEQLNVMISGGFAMAYREVIPVFEHETGIRVTTLSGASQGSCPKTIKWQLENGAHVDVVILSLEGLNELKAAGRIVEDSVGELATVPLAAAVRLGSPKPDIGTIKGFQQALLKAKLVAMPGSTSGIFVRDEVFPKLGIADKVSSKMMARGLESTAMLAAGEADLAIGPLSELVEQPGIEIVGSLPAEAQFVQTFIAAIVGASHRALEAERLIEFLTSDRTVSAIKKAGMTPIDGRRGR